MRKSSKILVFIFFAVAAGLVFLATQMDEDEIAAAVEQRLGVAVAEREKSLVEQEQTIQQRVAELDSAIARVEQPVLMRITAEQVENRLKQLGLAYEVGVDNYDDPLITFTLASYETKLFFYDCAEEGCASIRLYTRFDNTSSSVETVKAWNQKKRFSTAYINEDGYACLDTDLIMQGGVTLAEVDTFILNFRDRLGEYAAHLSE
ncbi:MAG TPA: YbjN domain-containing protein [Rhodothermales bacterium]|nr:YbjN domain-containing protein [Rhodothermales bacterium]